MVADSYHDQNGVLHNLLGITDARSLRKAEYAIARRNAPEAIGHLRNADPLDLNALCAAHRIVFADVYRWAGKTRKVPLFKGDSEFAPPDKINTAWMDALMDGFGRAARKEPERFRRHLAELWGRMTWLHPFPEGNGRLTQLFISEVARRHGKAIDWSRIDPIDERNAGIDAVRGRFGLYDTLLIGPMTAITHVAGAQQPWITREE